MLNEKTQWLLVFVILALLTLFISDDKAYTFAAKLILFFALFLPTVSFGLGKVVGVKKGKAIIANTMLLGVTVVVMLVFAEFFVRILFADITTTSDNASYFALRWKAENKPSVNSFGFREREISRQKPVGTYRIAVIGDSLTYGQGIAEDQRFSHIIEQKLNTGEAKVEVLNFGRPGAETIDHIDFLDDVFQVEPDFILLQWFTNDVEGRDKSARPRPYRLIPSDYLSGVLHRNSALYFLIKQRWMALQASWGLIGTYQQSMTERFADANSVDSLRAKRELEKFVAKVKQKDIKMAIVMFPQFVETGGDMSHYPFSYLFDRVADSCRENSVVCIDMRPFYADISPVSGLWVNKFDSHPSALANKIAADAVLDSMH